MRRSPLAVLTTIALALLCSCDKTPNGAVTACEQSQVFAGVVKTDILFVIDDSGSMSQEQERLRVALSNFINTLSASPIADDFQIGVTNTSLRTYLGGTAYTAGPSSSVPYPAGALISVDPTSLDLAITATWGEYFWTASPASPGPGFYGPRSLDYQFLRASDTATLVNDFQNDVLVGTFGSGREQPFEVMRLALSTQLDPGGENVGFLRSGARLAVIFLTDEDDCSGPTSTYVTEDAHCYAEALKDPSVSKLTPVSEYVDFLKGQIGGEPREVVVGAVAGFTCSGGPCRITTPLCGVAGSGALSAPTRVLELLSAFPPARKMLASICDTSFASALDQFADAVMSQTVPIVGGVADPAMLLVTVTKPTGVVACTVKAASDTAGALAADAVYRPPGSSTPATLTFQNACALAPGDRISIDVICAG